MAHIPIYNYTDFINNREPDNQHHTEFKTPFPIFGEGDNFLSMANDIQTIPNFFGLNHVRKYGSISEFFRQLEMQGNAGRSAGIELKKNDIQFRVHLSSENVLEYKRGLLTNLQTQILNWFNKYEEEYLRIETSNIVIRDGENFSLDFNQREDRLINFITNYNRCNKRFIEFYGKIVETLNKMNIGDDPEPQAQPFNLQPRQDFTIQRYLQYCDNNLCQKSMLLVHSVGTGKTITSLIMALNSLVKTIEVQGREIDEKLGDNTGERWPTQKQKELILKHRRILIVAPSAIYQNYINDLKLIGGNDIIELKTESTNDSKFINNRTYFKFITSRNPMKHFRFCVDEVLWRDIYVPLTRSSNELKQLFNGQVCIFDEAHRLFRRNCGNKYFISYVLKFNFFINLRRAIFLTATPYGETIVDFVQLLSLINRINTYGDGKSYDLNDSSNYISATNRLAVAETFLLLYSWSIFGAEGRRHIMSSIARAFGHSKGMGLEEKNILKRFYRRFVTYKPQKKRIQGGGVGEISDREVNEIVEYIEKYIKNIYTPELHSYVEKKRSTESVIFNSYFSNISKDELLLMMFVSLTNFIKEHQKKSEMSDEEFIDDKKRKILKIIDEQVKFLDVDPMFIKSDEKHDKTKKTKSQFLNNLIQKYESEKIKPLTELMTSIDSKETQEDSELRKVCLNLEIAHETRPVKQLVPDSFDSEGDDSEESDVENAEVDMAEKGWFERITGWLPDVQDDDVFPLSMGGSYGHKKTNKLRIKNRIKKDGDKYFSSNSIAAQWYYRTKSIHWEEHKLQKPKINFEKLYEDGKHLFSSWDKPNMKNVKDDYEKDCGTLDQTKNTLFEANTNCVYPTLLKSIIFSEYTMEQKTYLAMLTDENMECWYDYSEREDSREVKKLCASNYSDDCEFSQAVFNKNIYNGTYYDQIIYEPGLEIPNNVKSIKDSYYNTLQNNPDINLNQVDIKILLSETKVKQQAREDMNRIVEMNIIDGVEREKRLKYFCPKFSHVLINLLAMKAGYMYDYNAFFNEETKEVLFETLPVPHTCVLVEDTTPFIYDFPKFTDRIGEETVLPVNQSTHYYLPLVYSNSDEMGVNLFVNFVKSVGFKSIVFHEEGDKFDIERGKEVAFKLVENMNRERFKNIIDEIIEDHSAKYLTPTKLFEILDKLSTYCSYLYDDPICISLHPTMTEGINCKYNPAIFLLEPPISYPNLEQILGRITRTYSNPYTSEIKKMAYIYATGAYNHLKYLHGREFDFNTVSDDNVKPIVDTRAYGKINYSLSYTVNEELPKYLMWIDEQNMKNKIDEELVNKIEVGSSWILYVLGISSTVIQNNWILGLGYIKPTLFHSFVCNTLKDFFNCETGEIISRNWLNNLVHFRVLALLQGFNYFADKPQSKEYTITKGLSILNNMLMNRIIKLMYRAPMKSSVFLNFYNNFAAEVEKTRWGTNFERGLRRRSWWPHKFLAEKYVLPIFRASPDFFVFEHCAIANMINLDVSKHDKSPELKCFLRIFNEQMQIDYFKRLTNEKENITNIPIDLQFIFKEEREEQCVNRWCDPTKIKDHVNTCIPFSVDDQERIDEDVRDAQAELRAYRVYLDDLEERLRIEEEEETRRKIEQHQQELDQDHRENADLVQMNLLDSQL